MKCPTHRTTRKLDGPEIYEAFTYHQGKPVIGTATREEGGAIRVHLQHLPLDGVFFLRPKKGDRS